MVGMWTQAAIGLLIGLLPGLTLFIWLASPFGPSIPYLNTVFARVLLTVSQFIRGNGVLVKRKNGNYEIGTFVDDEAEPYIQATNAEIPVDPDNLTWGLFGKKDFGITWEPGTELHQRMQVTDPLADGGKRGYEVNMAAAHRYLEGTNEMASIERTEEHAEAQFGGGNQGFGTKMKIAYVIVMLLLGILTTFLAMG